MSDIDEKAPLSVHSQFKSMADDVAELRVLDLIERSPQVSERKITAQTGLAAGLVHSMMKRIIAKGWVKANQVSARRWLYYLTPEGFYEKGRLTLDYLSATVNSYRKTQTLVDTHIGRCLAMGKTRIVVVGDNDLADITALNVRAHPHLTLVALLGEGEDRRSPDDIGRLSFDAALVCDATFLTGRDLDGVKGKIEPLGSAPSPFAPGGADDVG